jgi:hypothetical protein
MLISSISTVPYEFLITGDFNVHVDDPTDLKVLKFIPLLDLANLTQHVLFSTHCHSHTFDLVMASSNSSLFPIYPSSPIFPSVPPSKHLIHSIYSIDMNSFIHGIMSSNLFNHPPTNLSGLVDCYNCTLTILLNKHAPVKSKILHSKPANHYFTPGLNKLKLAKRHLKRLWSKSHSLEDLRVLQTPSNHYHVIIKLNESITLISLLLVLLILLTSGKQ